MLRNRLVVEWTLVLLFGLFIAASTAYFGAANKLDNLLFDVAAPLRAAEPDNRILIVEIDNESLAAIGKWPWPRRVHARFFNQLNTAAPRVIAYDVLFLEAGPRGSGAADDLALAAAIKGRAKTLLPVLHEVPGRDGAAEMLRLPIAPLRRVVAGVGQANLLFDSDGLVRRVQLRTDAAETQLPHLMELAHGITQGTPSKAFARLRTSTSTDDDQSPLLPILPAGSYRRVSFASVLQGQVPAAFLRDKIILVGATAEGMGDRYPVSALAGSTMAGIEIQANLLNALITDRLIHATPRWRVVSFSGAPVVLLMLLFWRFRPTANLALLLIFAALVLGASLAALAFGGIWFPPAAALIGIAISYPLWSWRRLHALSGFLAEQSIFLKAASEQPATNPFLPRVLDSIGRQAADLESVIHDLADRKQFVSDIIAGLPDAVCVIDSANRVTLANPAAIALFGVSAAGAVMRDLMTQIGAGHVGDGEEFTLATGRSFLKRNVLFGEHAGSISIFSETTAIRELGREREEMLEFLSHDMRAPQTAILMLIGGDATTPIATTSQARIADYARTTLRLADDFVQLARLKSIAVLSEDVDLAAVASEAVDMAWPQSQARGITILTSGLENEIFVAGDAGALLRAFANLIDNAVKYGPANSRVQVALTIDRQPGKSDAVVTILDQGAGLPPGRAKDVFARYGGRGDSTVPGSGLGLAFVKAVVQQHGGEVCCDTDASRGTRFTVRLPLIAVS